MPGARIGGTSSTACYLETTGGLYTAVHLHAAVEHEGVGLVAEGVYVGAGVLPTDDDPGGAGARPGFFGPVLVFVVAVEQVNVTRLLVGRVDGHLRRARLLEIEHAP